MSLRTKASALIAATIAASLAVSSMAAEPAQAQTDGSLLSAVGQQGIDDLRACLTQDAAILDVFYLVDNSGSLRDSASTAGTDPDKTRADLLASSLRQLAQVPGVQVNYAMGFFSDRYTDAIGWTAVPSVEDSPDAVDVESRRIYSEIQAKKPAGKTDWLRGLEAAQRHLAAQRAGDSAQSAPRCQTLIWFTDGGLNVAESPARSAEAFAELCGAGDDGLVSALRRAGTTVFGVRFNNLDASQDRWPEFAEKMSPLVEGPHAPNPLCGGTAHEGETHGVYMEAQNAGALATVFMGLGVAVGGGRQGSIAADGTFSVQAGVSTFSLVTASAAVDLTTADGTRYTDVESLRGAGFTVEEAGAAKTITSPAIRPGDYGDWRWGGPTENTDLYVHTGFAITFSDPDPALIAGGDPSELTLSVEWTGEGDVSLDDIRFDRMELSALLPSGEEAIAVERVDGTNEFVAEYAPSGVVDQIVFTATLTGLSTIVDRIALPDVTARRAATIAMRDEMPTATVSFDGERRLIGDDGTLSGAITVVPPADGTSTGEVCFDIAGLGEASADGVAAWAIAFDGGTASPHCVTAGPGNIPEPIRFTLTTDDASNRDVTTRIPVSYSGGGDTLDGELAFTFQIEKPADVGRFIGTLIALILAGVLAPIVLLWFFTWLFTRINVGRHLLRASLPVRITPDGQLQGADGEPLAGRSWSLSDFQFQAAAPDARVVEVAGLGTFAARVSPVPFRTPWYEIVAPEGRRLIGPTAAAPASRRAATAAGLLRVVPGDLGRLWGISIPADVAAGPRDQPVAGQLVAYLRAEKTDPELFRSRIDGILRDPAVARQLAAIRESGADQPAAARPNTRAPRAEASDDRPRVQNPAATSNEPPRRSVSGVTASEPPRRGASSPTASEPPRRGAASPGSSPSGAVPPRASEPPRRGSSPPGTSEPPRRPVSPSSDGPPPPRRSR